MRIKLGRTQPWQDGEGMSVRQEDGVVRAIFSLPGPSGVTVEMTEGEARALHAGLAAAIIDCGMGPEKA